MAEPIALDEEITPVDMAMGARAACQLALPSRRSLTNATAWGKGSSPPRTRTHTAGGRHTPTTGS